MDAVRNGGPREDSTRIGSAGVVRRQAVDVSPLRRLNQAIYLICTGARYDLLHQNYIFFYFFFINRFYLMCP